MQTAPKGGSSPTRAPSTRSPSPDQVVACDAQEKQLAALLNGVHEDYLPTTVSMYVPPDMDKTLTTLRLGRRSPTKPGASAPGT